MAAHDRDVARQNEELLPNRGEDRVGVAAPEVGAADGAAKERVAGEEHRVVAFEQKGRRPGRVAGRMDRAQREGTESDSFPVCERRVEGQRRLGAEPEEGGLFGERVVEGAVGRVESDGRPRGFLERAGAGDVVEVRVRVEERNRLELRGLERAQNALRLVSGIDDDGLPRDRVREDRAVALQRSDGKSLDERLGAQGFTATTVSTS